MGVRTTNLLKICVGRRIRNGKASSSYKWFYKVLFFLRRHRISRPTIFIHKVLEKLRPPLGIKIKKISGTKTKIPTTLPLRQQYQKSVTWLNEAAKKRGGGFLSPKKFASEIYLTGLGKSSSSWKTRRIFLKTLLDSRAFLKHIR